VKELALKLRDEARDDAPTTSGAVKEGDSVTKTGVSDDGVWLKVETVEGSEGWIKASMLQPDPSCTAS
jgi:hypothetical protein